MKHVNEPPPNLARRTERVPLRVAAAVDRALEKDPAQRFPSMKAFAAELEACLASLSTSSDDTSVIASPKRKRRRKKRVSAWSIATIGMALLALGAIAAGLLLFRNGSTESPAATKPITLDGIASYDPFGDDREHDEVVANATDRNPGTYWTTEDYRRPPARQAGSRARARRRRASRCRRGRPRHRHAGLQGADRRDEQPRRRSSEVSPNRRSGAGPRSSWSRGRPSGTSSSGSPHSLRERDPRT